MAPTRSRITELRLTKPSWRYLLAASYLERPSKNLEHGLRRDLSARGLGRGVGRGQLRRRVIGVCVPEGPRVGAR